MIELSKLEFFDLRYEERLRKYISENQNKNEVDFIRFRVEERKSSIINIKKKTLNDYCEEVKQKHPFKKSTVSIEIYEEQINRRTKYYKSNVDKSIPSIKRDIEEYEFRLSRILDLKSEGKGDYQKEAYDYLPLGALIARGFIGGSEKDGYWYYDEALMNRIVFEKRPELDKYIRNQLKKEGVNIKSVGQYTRPTLGKSDTDKNNLYKSKRKTKRIFDYCKAKGYEMNNDFLTAYYLLEY